MKFTCNRKYEFELYREGSHFFVQPLTNAVEEYNILSNKEFMRQLPIERIEVFPDKNGNAWFQFDFFCFGVNVNCLDNKAHAADTNRSV